MPGLKMEQADIYSHATETIPAKHIIIDTKPFTLPFLNMYSWRNIHKLAATKSAADATLV